MKLSKNLSLKEATKSDVAISNGIDNTPTPEEVEILKLTASKVFQPIRDHFGVKIKVTSMFRSASLNKKLRGSKTSSHMSCQAIDIDADAFKETYTNTNGEEVLLTNSLIFAYAVNNLEFDTVIWEFGDDNEPDWVHISYREGNNRTRVLRARRGKSGVYYEAL